MTALAKPPGIEWKNYYRTLPVNKLYEVLDLHQHFQQTVLIDNNEGKYSVGQAVRLLITSQERVHQLFEVILERMEVLESGKS